MLLWISSSGLVVEGGGLLLVVILGALWSLVGHLNWTDPSLDSFTRLFSVNSFECICQDSHCAESKRFVTLHVCKEIHWIQGRGRGSKHSWGGTKRSHPLSTPCFLDIYQRVRKILGKQMMWLRRISQRNLLYCWRECKITVNAANNLAFSYKVQHRFSIWPWNHTPTHPSENLHWYKNCTRIFVANYW